MQQALVVGSATSTIKHPSMQGTKLLIVQPLLADGRSPDGDPCICVDRLGAGRGETVIITSDGRYAREILQADATPVRWTTLGIQDA
ncbi:EutN/CcmL family microcompartment protein [Lignipirellula cremea]|uniref:Ethanolamine utilization protein EutN n=1 Tax=Lignipirellula cremea TaxID=2528010 RepID=A0A518DMQ3_9BACT|nr:EutN/CcmL family microcompartment protein [Lignipirellula cremea]QDU93124.1 Ethanolamine utilization protein EutN [Lignipirellula cremea]